MASSEVWQDIRSDCNRLLEDVKPSVDWHKRTSVLLSYTLIVPGLLDLYKKFNHRLTEWDRTWHRKLVSGSGDHMIRSVGSIPPSISDRVEIHPIPDPLADFIILQGSTPFLVRPMFIPRGDGLAIESAGPVTPKIAQGYRLTLDQIKQEQHLRTH